jgi:hypothetical protein
MGLIGNVDIISETSIAGWAADDADLHYCVSVDIAVNALVVATVCCAGYREDLLAAGIGDGSKAFQYDPSVHFRPGRNVVEVRHSGTHLLLNQGRASWVQPRLAPGSYENSLLAALEAYHEFTARDHICWIGDGASPFEHVLLQARIPFRRYSVVDPSARLPENADVVICAPGAHVPIDTLPHLLQQMNTGGLLAMGLTEAATPAVVGIPGIKLESIGSATFAFAELQTAAPVIAHIHVPKCAGTSLRILFQRYFKARHLPLYVDDTYFVYPLETLRSYLLRNPDLAGFSSHHMRTFPRWLAGRRMLYITFLRDPLQQFVSYMTHVQKYYAQISAPSLLDALPPDAPHLSLRDFARWLLTNDRDIPFRENHNVNFFARHNHPDAIERLHAAEAALSEFFFVGITERMEESLCKLRALARAAAIDFPPDPMLFENISSDYRDDLGWIHPADEVGSLLLRSVEKDRRLYDWALARLENL